MAGMKKPNDHAEPTKSIGKKTKKNNYAETEIINMPWFVHMDKHLRLSVFVQGCIEIEIGQLKL